MISPINGTANDVAGTDSATMSENTLKLSRIVIPAMSRPNPQHIGMQLNNGWLTKHRVLTLTKCCSL